MNKIGRPPKTIAARFWPKVNVCGGDDCWCWLGSTHGDGYGSFRVGNRKVNAHRVAWELAVGTITEEKHVCHRCDNRLCVNPAHLFLGTAQDNVRDMHNKGRGANVQGVLNPVAKLTDKEIREIRCYCKQGRTQTSVANMFGVTQPLVSKIVTRQVWAHVA